MMMQRCLFVATVYLVVSALAGAPHAQTRSGAGSGTGVV